MNQNYGFTAGYGTPLTTTQTANYGTQNPGPTAVTPFMSETVRGEMMGTASDGSSLAAHSPIVHAIPVKIMTPPGKHFIPEGTLMLLTHGLRPDQTITQAAQNCKSSEDYVIYANAPGSAMVGPGPIVNNWADNPIKRIIPTASGCHNEDKTNNDGFVDVVAFAWKSVTRINLDSSTDVFFERGCTPDIIRPGQPLYAAVHLVEQYDTVDEYIRSANVHLFTNISLFRQRLNINHVNDVHIEQGTVYSKVFKLGTVTLPCDTSNDLWIYVNLCANQNIA